MTLKVLGILWFCLSVLAPAARADTELTFCYDPYPPFTLGTGDTPEGGLKVTLLDEVMARIDGVTARVVLLPWKRCQEEARSGRVDGILPLFKSVEREAFLAFSDETFLEASHFWYRPDRFPDGVGWSGDFADVVSLRLAMLNGGFIDADMQDAFAAVRPIERADDHAGLFAMLRYGRVDLVAFDRAVGQYHLNEIRLEGEIVALDPAISAQYSHFGLSKASGADRHLDAINAALAEMRAEGRIDAIYKQ